MTRKDVEREADTIDLKLFQISATAHQIAHAIKQSGRPQAAHDWREVAETAHGLRTIVRGYMHPEKREATT